MESEIVPWNTGGDKESGIAIGIVVREVTSWWIIDLRIQRIAPGKRERERGRYLIKHGTRRARRLPESSAKIKPAQVVTLLCMTWLFGPQQALQLKTSGERRNSDVDSLNFN